MKDLFITFILVSALLISIVFIWWIVNNENYNSNITLDDNNQLHLKVCSVNHNVCEYFVMSREK